MRRYAVIGIGRFGSTLALQLAGDGAEVIALDTRRELVEAIADRVAHAVQLDASDERALRAQGVEDVDCAVVAIGENFEASILAAINCKNLGVKYVVARAATATQMKIMQLLGVDLVLQPEEETARRLAKQLLRPTILAIQEIAQGLSAVQLEAPAFLQGQTLAQLDLRRRYGATLVALRRAAAEEGGERGPLIYPQGNTRIERGDLLFLVGPDEDLEVLATTDRD